MDEDLSQLEAELKGLRPAAPSSALLNRIGRELEGRKESREPSVWWRWCGALPVAAALAIMTTFAMRRDPGQRAPAAPDAVAGESREPAPFQPVSAENVLYAEQDEGPVTLADGTPARREHRSFVDTITWKDTRTNASVRWSVPREEVRVVPVNFQ
jgi:hypothetical protein